MPKVSVIIPVYKVEKTLSRCIDSVRNQSIKDIEIILVDDGSPDNCPAICDFYASIDTRIKVIHKKNEGLGFARNSGMNEATGEYIAFVDSDDYVAKEMYEHMYNKGKAFAADAVYCGFYYVNNNQIKHSNIFDHEQSFVGKEGIKSFLMDLISSPITESEDSKYGATVWKAIFLNDIIKKHHIAFMSERDYVSEDSIFDLHFLSKANMVVTIPKDYYYYVYNPNSLTSTYRKDRFEKNKKLYNYMTEQLEINYDSITSKQYGRAFIAAARVCLIQETLGGSRIKGIKEICKDNLLQAVLCGYPWQKLPIKKCFFAFLMRYKLNWMIYLVVKLVYRGK